MEKLIAILQWSAAKRPTRAIVDEINRVAKKRPLHISLRRFGIPMHWENINEPGTYVDIDTGILHRISEDALENNALPEIAVNSTPGSKFVRLSADPFVVESRARTLCTKHSIVPHF